MCTTLVCLRGMGLVSLTVYDCICACLSMWPSFFFFKQKTAYEMRISDWSSDVCSSDLMAEIFRPFDYGRFEFRVDFATGEEIGRASCRERCVSTCRSRWSPYH